MKMTIDELKEFLLIIDDKTIVKIEIETVKEGDKYDE